LKDAVSGIVTVTVFAAAVAAAIPITLVVKSWRLSWLTTTEPGRVRIVTLPGFVCGIVGGIEIFKAVRSPSLA